MLLLAASLFFTEPAPLEMPRAEGYLVKEDGRYRLEDRYSKADLWTSRTVLGRWIDEDGRVFTLAHLATLPPMADLAVTETRTAYGERTASLPKKDKRHLIEAMKSLSPVELAEKGAPPRQLPRGYDDVDYWQGTNTSAIVCAFLPEKGTVWYLAVWELAEGDDIGERTETFEEKFLEKEFRENPPVVDLPPPERMRTLSERELLRQDAHHSVTNYSRWRWTDCDEYVVLDALPRTSAFLPDLTNEIKTMRAKYAQALPTFIDGSNVLAVARVFGSRDAYLSWADDDMSWTAAYWDPQRRELVAYLPEKGEAELLKTFRHEAFHQYLAYACSMIATSPWLNEGYAQYFEDENDVRFGLDAAPDEVARLLPALLRLDYNAFYAGSDLERRTKYRLARLLAVFIEKGMREIRNDPFEHFKRDYFKALFATRDKHAATDAAFGNAEREELFISEWVKFWKRMSAD